MMNVKIIFSLFLFLILASFVSAATSCFSDSDCQTMPLNKTSCILDNSGRYCSTQNTYQCCTDESTDIACFYYPDSEDANQNIPGKCILMGTKQQCYPCLEECNGGKCSYKGSLRDMNNNGYYEITTCAELQSLNENLYALVNYELLNDIDCSDTENWNNGAGFEPIGKMNYPSWTPFLGTFEGNNKTISNLYINRPSENFVGLFGLITGAKVYNLGLVNVYITGNGSVGGLVGSSAYYQDIPQGGIVRNSYSKGTITGKGKFVGGLIGYNYQTAIIDSYSEGKVSGNNFVGGLIGDNQYSKIENSYSTADVKSDVLHNDRIFVGGLVGYNGGDGLILKSYSKGSVNGGILWTFITRNIAFLVILIIFGVASFFIDWKSKNYAQKGKFLGFLLAAILYIPNLIKWIIFKQETALFSSLFFRQIALSFYKSGLLLPMWLLYIIVLMVVSIILIMLFSAIGKIIENHTLSSERKI